MGQLVRARYLGAGWELAMLTLLLPRSGMICQTHPEEPGKYLESQSSSKGALG